MQICPNCGSEQPERARKCKVCKARLDRFYDSYSLPPLPADPYSERPAKRYKPVGVFIVIGLVVLAVSGLCFLGTRLSRKPASPAAPTPLPPAADTPAFTPAVPTLPSPTLPPSQPPTATPLTGPEVGRYAPDFSLVSSNGVSVHLNELRGKGVMLVFWASWCGYCRGEMPDIQDIFLDYQNKGLVVMGINSEDGPDLINSYKYHMGVTFPMLMDSDAGVKADYRVDGVPYFFFIDPYGVVRTAIPGAVDKSALEQGVQSALSR